MSAFESTVKQISKILGITSAGQKAKSGSLPVTLASDEDLTGVLQGVADVLPAALGQQTKAGSLGVALASDDDLVLGIGATSDAAVLSDSAATVSAKLRGLVKWAAQRMPAALGQTTASASLPVVLASDKTVSVVPLGAVDLITKTNFATLDLTVSTTGRISGYAAPTGAFCDGADSGFGSSPRFLRIPLLGYGGVMIGVYSTLNQAITVTLWAWPDGKGDDTTETVQLDAVVAGTVFFSPLAAGGTPGSEYHAVPALAAPMQYAVVQITPAGDPSSGELKFFIARR